MALAQQYTAAPGDTITAARWNNEFGNIYNNGTSLVFPATTSVSLAGQFLYLDTAGGTSLRSSASRGLVLTPGAKSGTPGLAGKSLEIDAQTHTDTNTAASGTAAAQAFTSFQQATQAAANTSITITDAATVYIANAPLAGTNVTLTNSYALWVDDGTVRFDGALRVDGVLQTLALLGVSAFGGHINGLLYQNSVTDATNDLDHAIGMAVSDDTAYTARRTMVLSTALTKRSDAAWVAGTNQGGLDTGSVGNNGYYVWLIMRTDLTAVDILYSLSSTAPTMPANYTFKRLIGWFLRSGGALVEFVTYELTGGGLEFLWKVPTLDINLAATLTTSRRTDALKVPLNISTIANINVALADVTNPTAWICCPDQTDAAPSVTAAPLNSIMSQASAGVYVNMKVRTSAAGLIAARAITATVDLYAVSTLSFEWSRRT